MQPPSDSRENSITTAATGIRATGIIGRLTSLRALTGYFLKLGTSGFGGPVALVGFMHRDLVERRGWITEDTYKLSLALAQIMPGPLAAQTAIAIGYFEGGVLGATLVGLAFVLPSFLMVIAISWAYVTYGGLCGCRRFSMRSEQRSLRSSLLPLPS